MVKLGERAQPLLHLSGMCVLRRFVQAQVACRHQHHRQLSLVRHQRVLLPRSRCPSARQHVLQLWPS